jgi:hypothetical protein
MVRADAMHPAMKAVPFSYEAPTSIGRAVAKRPDLSDKEWLDILSSSPGRCSYQNIIQGRGRGRHRMKAQA